MISQKDNEEGKLFVGGKLKDFIQILTLDLEHCGVLNKWNGRKKKPFEFRRECRQWCCYDGNRMLKVENWCEKRDSVFRKRGKKIVLFSVRFHKDRRCNQQKKSVKNIDSEKENSILFIIIFFTLHFSLRKTQTNKKILKSFRLKLGHSIGEFAALLQPLWGGHRLCGHEE